MNRNRSVHLHTTRQSETKQNSTTATPQPAQSPNLSTRTFANQYLSFEQTYGWTSLSQTVSEHLQGAGLLSMCPCR